MSCAGTVAEIAAELGVPFSGEGSLRFNGVSTDTRTVEKGMLFVALCGEHFDGSAFVAEAYARGAVAVVAPTVPAGCSGIAYADTLEAYQRVARWHRRHLSAQIVSITGSCGKTSVKEIAATICESQGSTFKNYANFNNQIGVAHTLLAAPCESRYGIVEAGTNHPGEIPALARIIEADIAVITNVGISHTEHFETIEALIAEKMSLTTALGERGVSIIPADGEYHQKFAAYPHNRIVSYGFCESADYYPEEIDVDARGRCSFTVRGVRFETGLSGLHSVRNVLAAVAAVAELGISLEEAARALRGYSGYEKRFTISEEWGRTLIDDTYNANLISTCAALDTVGSFGVAGQKIAVLGSMLELGEDSEAAHRQVLERALKTVDIVYTLGDEYACCNLKSEVHHHFAHPDELCAHLYSHSGIGDAILFKGSRGMRMERILTAYREAVQRGE